MARFIKSTKVSYFCIASINLQMLMQAKILLMIFLSGPNKPKIIMPERYNRNENIIFFFQSDHNTNYYYHRKKKNIFISSSKIQTCLLFKTEGQ